MSRELEPSGASYEDFLQELKQRILEAQSRAGLAVNRELIALYWQIGREILLRQQRHNWGARVIQRLAVDLRQAFPGAQGWSSRNLHYMRAFAEAYPDEQFVQAAPAQIPWFHNVVLLDRVKDPAQRAWYIEQVVRQGWSGRALIKQIEANLFERQGHAVTNFTSKLPAAQSSLASETLKDPYNFDFLTLGEAAQERDLEKALLGHIQEFLLELGAGFAFVGSQYHLEVGGQDFYIDLLFYHLTLRCFVVIDLKAADFQPEFAGKMNFYLSAVDDLLRHPSDQPSIGIVLCKSKNKVVAEYTLRDVNKPMGVSVYLSDALPERLRQSLPTIAELEAQLGAEPMETH